jgi:hypothetical protein
MLDSDTSSQQAKLQLTDAICDFDGTAECASAIEQLVFDYYTDLAGDEVGLGLIKSLPSVLANTAQKRVLRPEDYYCAVLRLAFLHQSTALINALCVLGHAHLIVRVALESPSSSALLSSVCPRNPVVLQLFMQAQDTLSLYLTSQELTSALPSLVFKLRSPSLAGRLVGVCLSCSCVPALLTCVLQEWPTARWIERSDEVNETCNFKVSPHPDCL